MNEMEEHQKTEEFRKQFEEWREKVYQWYQKKYAEGYTEEQIHEMFWGKRLLKAWREL